MASAVPSQSSQSSQAAAHPDAEIATPPQLVAAEPASETEWGRILRQGRMKSLAQRIVAAVGADHSFWQTPSGAAGCTLPVIDACAGCGGGIRMVMHIFAEMRAQLGVVVYVEHLCSIERDPVARAFLKAAGHVGKPLFGNLTDVLEPLAYDYMTEAMVAPPRSGPPGRRSSLHLTDHPR